MEIGIVWIGAELDEAGLLDGIERSVTDAFGLPVRRREVSGRPADTLDPRRGQHASGRILRWLAEQHAGENGKTLGITDVDLFIPVLTFVFGEAQLGGRAAVVSTARLCADAAGRYAPSLLRVRLAKEAVHEVGHTFGLVHCATAGCAMSRSPGLHDVDAKTAELCPDCRSILRDRQREGEGR